MKEGTIITTPAAGTVVKYVHQTEMGNTLYLKDGNNLVHVFAHLKEPLVTVGTSVAKDAPVALSGNTGTKAGPPHLHYEIISPTPEAGNQFMTRSLQGFSGYNINPETYLQSLGSAPVTPSSNGTFVDVPAGTWYEASVELVAAQQLVQIPPDRQYHPERPLTRAELAVVMARHLRKHHSA